MDDSRRQQGRRRQEIGNRYQQKEQKHKINNDDATKNDVVSKMSATTTTISSSISGRKIREGETNTLECGKIVTKHLFVSPAGLDLSEKCSSSSSSSNVGGNANEDCDERSYKLYFPTSLCKKKENDNNGSNSNNSDNSSSRNSHDISSNSNIINGADDDYDILPVVFAVHCLGCSTQTMAFLGPTIAEEYSFILVIPEGKRHSWNAGDCCGYALENNIDDVAFFRTIISQLLLLRHDEEKLISIPSSMSESGSQSSDDNKNKNYHQIISKDIMYAMGWSNGAYMITKLATLKDTTMFRAVAPISGYQSDLPSARLRQSVGLFMHHSSDDNFVRITGCCKNSTMASCCCGISEHRGAVQPCVSAEQIFLKWADKINRCGRLRPAEEENEIVVSLSSFSPTSTSTDIGTTITNTQKTRTPGVVCYTNDSVNCRANTTFCVHSGKGHFTTPSFESSFPMFQEIASFFAIEACNIYGGKWSNEQRSCTCSVGSKRTGRYCLNGGVDRTSLPIALSSTATLTSSSLSLEDTSTTTSIYTIAIITLSGMLFMGGIIFAYIFYQKKKSKKSYEKYKKVSTIELRRVKRKL